MSPRTSEQFEKIREEKKAHIRNVALTLFADKGYFPTSVSKIAVEAGISKGLLYNYYKGKEELLEDILDQGFNSVIEGIDFNGNMEVSHVEFIAFLNRIFDEFKKEFKFWRLFYSLILQADVMEILAPKMSGVFDTMYGLLERYFVMMNYENPKQEMLIFGALIEGTFIQYVAAPDSYPIDEMKKAILSKYS
jgi:AcrR family transcriptional regulator